MKYLHLLLLGVLLATLLAPRYCIAEAEQTVTISRADYEKLLQRLDAMEKEIQRLKEVEKQLEALKKQVDEALPCPPEDETAVVLEPPRKFLGLFGEQTETIPSLDIAGHITVQFEYSNIEREGRFTFACVEIAARFNLFEELQVGVDLDFSEPRPNEDDFYVEQAFIAWAPWADSRMEFTAGRFNSVIGIEAVDAPFNIMASRSFMSTYLTPGDQTGVMLAWGSGSVNLFGAMTNSYGFSDSGERISSDNNNDNTWTTRLEFRPGENSSFGLNAIIGPERDNNDSDYRVTLDLDAQMQEDDFYYLGFEVLYGFEEDATGADPSWLGAVAIGRYTFSKMLDISLRLEYLDDMDGGSRLRKVDAAGQGYRLWSSAVALSFRPLTNMDLTLEYRYDGGDEGFYAPEDDKRTFSVEVSVRF